MLNLNLPLRAIQLILAIITLGLNGYGTLTPKALPHPHEDAPH